MSANPQFNAGNDDQGIQGQKRAEIGQVDFPAGFTHPTVDIIHDFRTVEHQILTPEPRDSDHGVQVMGRKPATIMIEEPVPESTMHELEAQNNTSQPLFVSTARWNGTVTPSRLRFDYMNEEHRGEDLYEMMYELREIKELLITDDAISTDNLSEESSGGPAFLGTPANFGVIKGGFDTKIDPNGPDRFIGNLVLRDRYNKPIVDRETKHRRTENTLLDPVNETQSDREFDVRSKGKESLKLTVNCIVPHADLRTVDTLGRDGPLYIQIPEYTGTAVVTKVSTTDREEYDDVIDEWIHDCKIDLISLAEDEIFAPCLAPEKAIPDDPYYPFGPAVTEDELRAAAHYLGTELTTEIYDIEGTSSKTGS